MKPTVGGLNWVHTEEQTSMQQCPTWGNDGMKGEKMSILIKGMDMLKDGTYTSNIHVKGGKAVLDNPIGLGYFELVEVVHGEWLPIDVGDCCYRCSVCNFVRDAYLLEEDNYCPHCGARMFVWKTNGEVKDD